MTKPRLSISNSGGRTSALMTKLCLEQYKDTHEIVVTFANTGQEHEETLLFIKRCDDYFGFKTVWLEAVIGPTGVGTRHRCVTFESASRNGEPFEAYIRKHGIPNKGCPQCTSRLKTEVMESYLKTLGFKRGKKLNYNTAIGIRADEMDRISSVHKKKRYVYPLVRDGITKADVLAFWKRQPFDLNLPGEHYGNCVTCWKKSYRKLMTIAVEQPQRFEFFDRMEKEHKMTMSDQGKGRVFFRDNKSCQDIIEMSKQPFELYSDNEKKRNKRKLTIMPDDLLDVGSSCGESCEIGADE